MHFSLETARVKGARARRKYSARIASRDVGKYEGECVPYLCLLLSVSILWRARSSN